MMIREAGYLFLTAKSAKNAKKLNYFIRAFRELRGNNNYLYFDSDLFLTANAAKIAENYKYFLCALCAPCGKRK